ncbi:Spy/CpxP family protein refolding chaperone [Ideonella oryzae]|uniref:Spy/CpxP family protein refolding chaperone n=1 Tax=Ideonella oryzae TaxID=2937441 RepID=A0ABT1BJI9_9BURK|nr:Spy/CpxP family protein refolding chaperone [Ideonella oryzae]MCO5976367.1 Spy/CpxP family protein refolding chaperone [Ideonella oryzae]
MKRSTWGGSQARIACAGLLLVLLGGLGMVALASAQGLPPPGPRAMPMPGPGAPVLGGLLHCDRLPPELALTAAQQGQLQAIAEGLHADQVQQREADRALADRWATLLAAQTVDAQAAEALRAQMEQAHDKMSRRLLKATLDAAEVLTPAQRAQLVLLSKAPAADGGHGDLGEGPWPDPPSMPPPPHLVP